MAMSAGKRITKTAVERLAPGETLWDCDVRGFGVRHRQRELVYMLKTRIDGRQRFLTIGRHGSPWTPDTARGEARRLLGSIHAGDDPATRRDARKREPTVAAVLDRYLAEHVAPNNKASTASEIRRHVETKIKPILGRYRISELSRADLKKWHATFRNQPYEGNRSLAYLRKALSLASTEWELRPDNPARGITLFPERRRERFFTDHELKAVGEALGAIELEGEALPGAIRVIRLLALTGLRLSEVIGLQWAWISFEDGCVHLPDAKAGARTTPIGGAALAYLGSLERTGAYVCYGTHPAAPISLKTVKRFWPAVRERAGLSNARMHDFRHTVGTFTAMTGANAFVVRDVLGHKDLATTAGYVAKVVDPARKAADQVSSRVAAALNAQPGAVSEIIRLRNS